MRPKAVVRLLQPHHCVKNVLVLCPLFFNGRLFDPSRWGEAAVAFAAFTCVAAAVYALNDCMDARRDRLHPTKRFRPVASGEVSQGFALALAAGLCVAAVALVLAVRAPRMALAWLGAYVAVNVLYSLGLKNRPVLDVALLSSGFLIRVMFGAAATGVAVSHWLYLTVLAGAFYLGLGKRRNELRRMRGGRTRQVPRFCNVGFLEQQMGICLGLALTFYALWAANQPCAGLIWTVPVALLILMRYGLAVQAFLVRRGAPLPWAEGAGGARRVAAHFLSVRFLRFLLCGGVNVATGVGFAWGFACFLQANVAFVAGYALSHALSYLLNAALTFRARPTLTGYGRYVLAYIPNFLIQNVLVAALHNAWGVPPFWAFLASALLAIPITFLALVFYAFARGGGVRGRARR